MWSKKMWNNIVPMQKSFLNMNLITIRSYGTQQHNGFASDPRVGSKRTDFNWNKIIGNMHRRPILFSSRSQCSRFMSTMGKSAIDLFTFFHHRPFCRQPAFCVANIRNQSRLQNLLSVNSLNNLRHQANEIDSAVIFLRIMTQFFALFSIVDTNWL